MTTLTFKPGEVIRTGDYPPRLVFVDFFNGEGVALQVDHPEEDVDDLIRQAVHLRRMHKAKNKRLDSAKRNG